MDVVRTIANMKDRYEALNGTVDLRDVVRELLVHIMQLEEICLQQQEEIDTLKGKNK